MSAPENPPAFPVPDYNTNVDWEMPPHKGMTLRDWFAGQAVRMMLNHEDAAATAWVNVTDQMRAARAYQLADAMLAERMKGSAE